jgi:hypothetical protein
MKKLMLALLAILVLPVAVTQATFAQNTGSFYVNNAYLKAGGTYDVVVHDTVHESLKLYVDDKNPVNAKVNDQGWVTFSKVKLADQGKLSFTKSVHSKSVAINYVKYFDVSGGQVKLFDTPYAAAQVTTNIIAARTKSTECQITPNREQDAACTPGAVFTNVTPDMICKSGYSSSVRNVSNSVKSQVYAEYGVLTHATGQYEVDHLIPLELGGSNDIANLWPEAAVPTPGFHEKDKVENYLHAQVCSHKIPLAEAQRQEANGWLQVYIGMFPAAPVPKPTPTPSPAPVVNPAPTPTPVSAPVSTGVVKKSTTSICHAPGTTYYDRTTNFTPFNTLDDCIVSGGRLPLR